MCGNVSTAKASMSVVTSTCRTRVFSEYDTLHCAVVAHIWTKEGYTHTLHTHTYTLLCHCVLHCQTHMKHDIVQLSVVDTRCGHAHTPLYMSALT